MIKKILILLVVLVIIGGFFDYYVRSYKSQNESEIDFSINTGDNLLVIGNNLSKKGIISYNFLFYYYAWKKEIRGKMISGGYSIPPHSSLAEISTIFISGNAKIQRKKTVDVLFREGLTIKQMAEILKKNNLPYDDFLKLAKNPSTELRTRFSFLQNVNSLEGYLFPAKYNLYTDSSAEEIIEKMLIKFDKMVTPSMREDINTSGKTLNDVIILASIVEAEVSKKEDREIVAGIFQNRLDRGMLLGSDATIDYIKEKSELKHSTKDLEIDSPYNTYKFAGLPPGPINNPSIEAVRTSINPKKTDYLFFLNNVNTGKTVFSKTFNEHISNKSKNGL